MHRRSGAILLAALALAVPSTARGADAPAPPAAAPGGVPAVLAAADPSAGPVPTADGLDRVLAPFLKDRSLASFGISVVDAATRQPLFGRRPTASYTPASVTKVLTAAAVLATLGPDATLRTRVVRLPPPGSGPSAAPTVGPLAGSPAEPTGEPPAPDGAVSEGPVPGPSATPGPSAPAAPPEIAIVGGGDPGLSSRPAEAPTPDRPWLPEYPRRAHLDTLADRTATALKADGVTRVRLRYDTSLFTGPTSSAFWPSTYTSSGVVGPVMALSADQARVAPLDGGRVNDPAARTSGIFARLLEGRGIAVVGSPRTSVVAPPDSAELARVESASVAALVEHMLVASDNDFAEALARHVAVARGVAASFENSAAAVRAVVAELGAPLDGVVTHDGSGLSRANRIPPQMLAQLIGVAATGDDLRLRPLIAGLAIAGLTGTLGSHFYDPKALPAAGVVRAKSGSLSGVVSLAGVVPAASGRLLAFAVESNDVRNSFAARIAIERIAAALLTCGCADAPAPSASEAPAAR